MKQRQTNHCSFCSAPWVIISLLLVLLSAGLRIKLNSASKGVQNTVEETEKQLNYAVHEHGVTFIDTAELCPVLKVTPAAYAGLTKEILGNWPAKRTAAIASA